MPEGADAVVMVEDTEHEDSDSTLCRCHLKRDVMKKGSDIKKGAVVLRKGSVGV